MWTFCNFEGAFLEEEKLITKRNIQSIFNLSERTSTSKYSIQKLLDSFTRNIASGPQTDFVVVKTYFR